MSKELERAIKALNGGEGQELYGVPCVVDSVDSDELTCECSPVNGDSPFLDVRIQAGEGSGCLMLPKVGSVVIVQPINEDTGYISLFSDIDSIQFLDGSYGGLIKIDDLVTKMNSIEDKVNNILSTLKTHTHPGVTSGPSTTSPSVDFVAIGPLQNTSKNDIENGLITHGGK